tara:strand:+ start:12032 stop:12565 length:534 start_codon:yes stop_codon:yes gene_type:complete
MQSVIELLSVKTSKLDTNSRSTSSDTPSLDKLGILSHLSQVQIYYLFAVYIEERRSLLMLRAHLITKFKLPTELMAYQLKVVNGALYACSSNAYRIVDCYKCKASGNKDDVRCKRCGGTGKTSKRPKVHEICNVDRNAWYTKNNALVREMYETIVDYLQQMDIEIREITNKNKLLTE